MLGTGTVGNDGTFTVTLIQPQVNGEELTVTQTDAAGNESGPSDVTAPDITAPDAPSDLQVSDDGGTVTGHGEPGATVEIVGPDGEVLGTGVVGNDGSFTIDLSTPQQNGEELTVTQTDAAGNESGPSDVTAPDITAPDAPSDLQVSDDGGTVTGNGEPGATVEIVGPDGEVLGTGVVEDDGSFTIDLSTPQQNGEELTATQTDPAGNESDPADVTAPDITAPLAPAAALEDDTGASATDGVTSDGTVVVSGLESGATWQYSTDGGGTWQDGSGASFDLAPGTYADGAVQVRQTDSAGNTGASDALGPITIDASAPVVTINPSNGTILAGTAEPGSTVEVDIGNTGTPDYTLTADPTGNWSVAPTPPVADDTTVSVTATDAAGNESPPQTTVVDTSLVDTIAPGQPIIITVEDDAGAQTGVLTSGDSTDDTTPRLSGSAEALSTVEIFQDGVSLGTVTADATGHWSFEPAVLAEGSYTFTATATDSSGNVSGASPPFELTVDITAPGAVEAGLENDTGASPTDGLTNDGTVLVAGLEPGTTWEYSTDGGATWQPGTGSSFELTLGTYADGVVQVRQIDAAGNTGPADTIGAVTIDTTAPAAPAGTLENDTGASSTDGITSDGTVLVNGLEPGATWEYSTDGGATWQPGSGSSFELAPGTYTDGAVQLRQTDAAGNISPVDTLSAIVLDRAAPAVPVITGAQDNVNPVAGNVTSGGSTNDTTPTLSGTADPGATVSIFDGATLVGTATADGAGIWTLTPTLAEGAHSLTASVTDPAGNTSTSGVYDLTVDTAPPAVTVNPTDGTVVSGTAEPGSTVGVDVGNTGTPDYTVVADPEGNWSVGPTPPIADDTPVSVTATDAAGNESDPVTTVVDTSLVDTTAPVAPVIVAAEDNQGPVTGTVSSGESTNDTTPVLSGTAEAGSTVEIFQDGVSLGSATADALGNWTFAPATLVDGTYNFTATATDAAGNASGTSTAFTLTVDTTLPAAPAAALENDTGASAADGVTSDGTVVVSGLEPDSTWEYTTDGGTTWQPGSGTSFDLAPGTYADGVVQVRQVDAAGNASLAANVGAVTVDTTAPVVAISGFGDDAPAIIGNVASGGLSNDATPVLTGTAEAGSAVSVFDNGALIGTVTADGSGSWSLTPTLAGGAHSFTATASDSAGNSATSAAYTVTVDLTAPAAPSRALEADTGPSSTDGVTSDGTVLVSGIEPGATWQYTTNGGATWQTGTGGSFDLAPGSYAAGAVQARQTDAAGNTGAAGSLGAITVDPTAPATPTITGAADNVSPVIDNVSNGGATNDPRPTLSGTAEAGSTVRVFDGTTLVGTTTADGAGNWTLTPTLAQGTHSFTVTSTDAAGNSATSGAYTLTVDTTAPGAPTADVDDATGTTVTGTGEPGAAVTVYAPDGTTVLGTGAVQPNGSYSVTIPAQTNGESLQVGLTDAAGNQSPRTTAIATDHLDAINNEATVDLTVTPEVVSQGTQSTNVGGLLNVGVLADTIDVALLSGGNALAFAVPENMTRQVTVDGTGDGLLNLSILGDADFDLLVYRVEDGATTATLVYQYEDWLQGSAADILLTDWEATALALPEFQGGGTYYVTLGNEGGFLDATLLSSLTLTATSDVLTDYAPPATVSGSVDGNVITDPGVGGTDVAPANSVVSEVNNVDVIGADTPIVGTYGTLVIDPDGTYTYTVNPNFTGAYGTQEVFTYTLTAPGGSSETAELVITLDFAGPPAGPDVTPPEPATADVDDATGAIVSGTGEAGATVTVYAANGTTVLGTGSVLSDGTYSVPISPAQIDGETVSVRLTDASGNVSEATSTTAPDLFAALDNAVTLNLSVTPVVTAPSTQTAAVGGLLDLGVLSDTINVSLLSGGALSFTIPEDTTRQVTVDGSGSALVNVDVLGDGNFDLVVYRAEQGSTTATVVYEQADWLQASGLNLFGVMVTPTWNAAAQALPTFQGGGTYYVTLGNEGGLLSASAISNLHIFTTSDVVTDYAPPATVSGSVSGNVISDDITPAGAETLTTVEGLPVSGLDTPIAGTYGTLFIDPDGTYTYTVNPNFTGEYGVSQDVFTYTWTGAGGVTETADLVITLDYVGPGATLEAATTTSVSAFSLLQDPGLTIDFGDDSLSSDATDSHAATLAEPANVAQFTELDTFHADPLFGADALGRLEEQPI